MRLIEIQTPLLDDTCVALSLRASERLSVEPSYTLEFSSPRPDLDLDALLGSPISIRIDLGEGLSRPFHALVFGAADTGQLDDRFTYRLELRSWLSSLEQNHNCRIFQDFSVPQIVEQVFFRYPNARFRFNLQGFYAPREYCVQFRESDLAFVKRLLEDEGLYFHVEHQGDHHTVVISDTQRFDDLPGRYARLRFLPDGEEHRAVPGREGVQRLQRSRSVRPTHVVLRDFDYHAPSKSLQVDSQSDSQADHAASATGAAAAGTPKSTPLELYDYAAGYSDTERGEWLARLRLHAIQADARLIQGQANAQGMSIARSFSLSGHPDPSRNRRFYVVSTQLAWLQDGPDSSAQGRNFTCDYLSLNDDLPFHPLRHTPHPEVPGTHSATVVGPEGSEIHTDRLGRIRVHFHWDRYKSTEEDASCWIRVSNAWAGKGWGVLAMPRVGQEVLVTYIDGDLDRPLVVGIVYNGENPVPYELPKDIRYSGLVSRSLKHGEPANASQITFDDRRGAERVMIHAERDLQHTIERNHSTAVGNHLNLSVGSILTIVTGPMGPGSTKPGRDGPPSSDEPRPSGSGQSAGSSGASGADTRSTQLTGQLSANAPRSPQMGAPTPAPPQMLAGILEELVGDLDPLLTSPPEDYSGTLTGIGNSATGWKNGATGVSSSLTGMRVTLTGVRFSMTGLDTTLTGIEQSFTGCKLSWTGCSSAVTGTRESYTGTSLSVTGCSESQVGTSTSVTGMSMRMTGVSSSLDGVSQSSTGSRTSMTGLSQSMVGVSMNMTGKSRSMTGISYSSTGQSTSETGMSLSSTGTATRQTGLAQSTTGVDISVTGQSSRTTGQSTSTKGQDTSYTGRSEKQDGQKTSQTGRETTFTGLKVSETGTSISSTGVSDAHSQMDNETVTGLKKETTGSMDIKM